MLHAESASGDPNGLLLLCELAFFHAADRVTARLATQAGEGGGHSRAAEFYGPSMGRVLRSWDRGSAVMLQRYLQDRGFQPAISADQLHQLFLLMRIEACQSLLLERPSGSEAEQAAAAQLAQHMVQDSRQLCRLQPESVPYMLRHAAGLLAVGQRSPAMHQYALALNAGRATRCQYIGQAAAAGCMGLSSLRVSCLWVAGSARAPGLPCAGRQLTSRLLRLGPGSSAKAAIQALPACT